MLSLETEFAIMNFQKEDSTHVIRWKPESEHLNEHVFKEQIHLWLGHVKAHHPQKLLIDTTRFSFIIVPRLQQWLDDKIFTIYPEVGVQKKAFLMPTDLFSQVGIQQATQTPKNQTFKVNYFDDEQCARDWLNT